MFETAHVAGCVKGPRYDSTHIHPAPAHQSMAPPPPPQWPPRTFPGPRPPWPHAARGRAAPRRGPPGATPARHQHPGACMCISRRMCIKGACVGYRCWCCTPWRCDRMSDIPKYHRSSGSGCVSERVYAIILLPVPRPSAFARHSPGIGCNRPYVQRLIDFIASSVLSGLVGQDGPAAGGCAAGGRVQRHGRLHNE